MITTQETLAGPLSLRPRRVGPTPLFRAVRTVGRWGLVAGVTGLLANVLLVVLFTTPADGQYAWTGPANDVVGDVSSLALIPVASACSPCAATAAGWARSPGWPSSRWR